MSLILGWDQANVSQFALGIGNLPAGATLQKAKLSSNTWFSSDIGLNGMQGAPPNTLLGIAYVPHGTAIPVITTANWKTSTFLVAGLGKLLAYDRWCINGEPADTAHTFLQHTYSSEIEIDFPFYNAAAFDVGISINWLGQGFWNNAVAWISYQFEAYFD